MISQYNKQALKNPWVLGLIFGFILFVLVNVLFIYTAFQQAPDLVKGGQGERQQADQQTLEGTGLLLLPAEVRLNQSQDYQALFQDKQGQAIALDSVTLTAYGPKESHLRIQTTMTAQAMGVYQTQIRLGQLGQWHIQIQAQQGQRYFSLTRSLTVLP